MRKTAAVFFGGRSCENEISIITGTMVCNVLRGGAYDVYPVYIAQDGGMFTGEALFDVASFRKEPKEFLPARLDGGTLYAARGKKLRPLARIDVLLNCCHGMGGEDGAVAGLADLNGVANASPAMAASAVFMDKCMTKFIAAALGVRTLPSFRVAEADFARRGAFAVRCIEERLGYPVIVKPARQGSSIGVFVAEDRESLLFALRAGFAYDTLLLAEKYLQDRREINCAAYRSRGEIVVSPCEEPKTSHKILTFADKYTDGGKGDRGDFPARLPAQTAEHIRGVTKLLYRRMQLRGIVRADFLLGGGQVYFNEMNTVPGSLAWYLFCKNLADFRTVLQAVLEEGERDFAARSSKRLLKNSGVLSAFPSAGRKTRR